MIDRLAELLGILETEDEDEREQDEDVVDAAPLTGPERRETAPVPAETEPPEQPGEAEPAPGTRQKDGTAPEEGGPQVPAIPEEDLSEPVPEELAQAVRETDAVRAARSGAPKEDGGMADPLPALTGEDGPVPEGAAKRFGEAIWPPAAGQGGDPSGLELLYRAAARAAEPVFEAPAAGQTGDRPLPDPVLSQAARMSVEELDRAMRRDSRRYDGGMTIY